MSSNWVAVTDGQSALETEYRTRLAAWSDIQGHLERLHDLAAVFPTGRVLELGVREGVSTAALLAAVEKTGGHLWSVDIAEVSTPLWWETTGLWDFRLGDDLDPEVLAWAPEQVEMLFIDTVHTYAHTLAELRAYVPRVVGGGVVACHDAELKSPEAASPDDPPFPVARALDTFCAETGLAWENHTGSYGLGVIRIPGV